jgi:ribosomal protein L37E
MNIFVCPKCGYGNINELSLCVVMHRVTEWEPSGSPKEFGEPEVDWESEMPYDSLGLPHRAPKVTLECCRCGEQFEKPKPAESARRIA